LRALKKEETLMIRPALLVLLFVTAWNGTAFAQDVIFKKTYYTAPTLKIEPAVHLTIGSTQLEIVGKKPKDFGSLTIPFASIDTMIYESDTRHRVAEGARTGVMSDYPVPLVSPVVGALMMTTKTTSYWLDIHYHDTAGAHTAVLRLDKTEYQQVLTTLKARTGKIVAIGNGNDLDQNLPTGSKDIDEVVSYSADALIAAIKPAMADVGCTITVDKRDRIECKRPRGGSELTGVGGEKVVATFEAKDNQTKVHIETDRGFNGHMAKKNWSTPIFKGMMNKLQASAKPL
jgi:hypothetical protein